MSEYDDTARHGTIYVIIRIHDSGYGTIVATKSGEADAREALKHLNGEYPGQKFTYRMDVYQRHERGIETVGN